MDRIQYILFTNAPTLWSVLIYGRGVTSRGRLCDAFDAALRDNLKPYGLYEPYCQVIGTGLLSREFYKTGNRSVLGIMKERIATCRWYRNENERYLVRMASVLNQTPSKPIGYKSPVMAFVELIDHVPR